MKIPRLLSFRSRRQASAHEPFVMDAEEAARFFQARGWISLSEWIALDEASREALADVGRALDADRAAANAIASSGPDGLAAVLGQSDGGQAEMDLMMARAMEHALRKRGGIA